MNRTVVDPGEYLIFATDHKYVGVGTHRLVINRALHHLDDTGTAHQDFPAQITVHARSTLNDVQVDKPTIKGGESFVLTIYLSENASAANARVDLAWKSGSAALVVAPTSAEVPANDNKVTLTIPTKKTGVFHIIKLEVSSVGAPKIVRVRVNP
jgi:hypothetical protein